MLMFLSLVYVFFYGISFLNIFFLCHHKLMFRFPIDDFVVHFRSVV